MCANHSRCNSEGNCNWTGDYGSYQEHIHLCTNTPLAQFGNETMNPADTPNPAPEATRTSDYVKNEDYALEVETTASEQSEHVDTESASESENADGSESISDSEHANSTNHPQEVVISGDRVSCQEHCVEAHEVEETPLADLIADDIHLRAKEACHAQEIAKEAHVDESTPPVAAREAYAGRSALNADAVPFKPANAKESPKTKRSSKKPVTQDIHGCSTFHLQAAALQYQAAQAQMTQMAYLHRYRAAQMAHYQAAYLQAHMNHMKLSQRCTRHV